MAKPFAAREATGQAKVQTSRCKPAPKSTKQALIIKQDVPSTNVPSIDKRKRIAANARERKRMHLLNQAYDKLRKRLADAENKSKYDVLVQAKEYIQALTNICKSFDKQNPNQCTRIEPVQDTWPHGCDDPQPEDYHQTKNEPATKESHHAPSSSPFSPAPTVKLEIASPPSSMMSSSEESCFSPMAQTESVIAHRSQTAQVNCRPTPISVEFLPSHPHNTNASLYYAQQVPTPNSCSALLSPPLSSTLSPSNIFKQDCIPTLDSLLMSGRHHHLGTTQSANNPDIYQQYYHTFYQIQRAT